MQSRASPPRRNLSSPWSYYTACANKWQMKQDTHDGRQFLLPGGVATITRHISYLHPAPPLRMRSPLRMLPLSLALEHEAVCQAVKSLGDQERIARIQDASFNRLYPASCILTGLSVVALSSHVQPGAALLSWRWSLACHKVSCRAPGRSQPWRDYPSGTGAMRQW